MPENQYQSTVVCIDSYDNRVLSGRMFDPKTNTDITFHSTMEFIKETESLLGESKQCQCFSMSRAFQPTTEVTPAPGQVVAKEKGQVATFLLRILFRKNASWQGSVAWIDGKLEESFRSVLELLLLIDSAIAC